jgi:ATP-dependent DNA ligase
VTGSLRLGVGHPTILDALALVHTGSRASRPVLERAYNICSDLGLVAATVVHGGLEAVEAIQVRPGNPVRPMLAQRMSSAAELLAKLGGSCAAEYKYDGVRVQAHRTADGQVELFTRRLERVGEQFPDVVELLEGGLGPRQVILEGEVVAADPVSGELRPFQEVMHRRRKHGIAEAIDEWPVSLYCFDLLYADGEDLTRLPYRQRRARLEAAVTPTPRLHLSTAAEADLFRTVCKCGTGFSDAELAALPERLAPLARTGEGGQPARVDTRMVPDVWFEPGLVVEVLGAELTLSPTHTAAWGVLKEDAGLALRFPRFTGRYRDDKAPEDATTVQEVLDLYRTARPTPAGS